MSDDCVLMYFFNLFFHVFYLFLCVFLCVFICVFYVVFDVSFERGGNALREELFSFKPDIVRLQKPDSSDEILFVSFVSSLMFRKFV